MLLVIDIGNTNLVFGIYKNGDLMQAFRLSTNQIHTSDEIGLTIFQYFNSSNFSIKNVKDVVICSVVPHLTSLMKSSILKYLFIKPLIIGDDLLINVTNLYINPKQAGVDRLINAMAAMKKYGTPLIIIDMGTATTIDAVNAKGEFMGGAIYPGLHVVSEILFNKTANLPEFQLAKPLQVIGKTTQECMQSGIYYGYLGAIEGILKSMEFEMEDSVKVIATGGLSKLLLEKNSHIDFIDETLTLEGIKFIYESAKK